jgi:3-methyladenine DNA glycosylase AlkD
MKNQWSHKGIIEKFEMCRNVENAGPMKAYMKHHFPFLGIKSPLRKELLRAQFQEYALPNVGEIFNEAWKLYELPEREYQYAAIALLDKMKKHFTTDDYQKLLKFIETKSWWDSVDSIAPHLVGHVVKLDRSYGKTVMLDWSQSDNMWTNRSSILHQLKFKKETDTDLLFEIILQHTKSNEFFIQKAIGWALREYAKTDPVIVKEFVLVNTLKPLSRREALKHIGDTA